MVYVPTDLAEEPDLLGEPRLTNDIDVVVDLHPDQVKRFCAEFPEAEFYLSEEAVRRAITRTGVFRFHSPGTYTPLLGRDSATLPFGPSLSTSFGRAAQACAQFRPCTDSHLFTIARGRPAYLTLIPV